jgi:hypothetical protein
MQLTPLLVCLMTVAPVAIHTAPVPPGGFSFDPVDPALLFPEGFPEEELDLVKRAPPKPAAKPAPVAAKPVAKPAPIAAKPVAKPAPVAANPVTKPAPVAAKPIAKPAPVAARPVVAPAKAPAAAKAPGAAKPAPAPAKPPATAPAADADGCTGIAKRLQPCKCFKKCQSCTAQSTCAFSTVTFKCVDKGNGNGPPDTIIAAEATQRCPAVQQQGAIFPAIQKPKGVADIPAGLPTPQIQAAFTAIQPHVFTRESAARPDSGQHLKSVWIANHPTGPKSVPTCNAATGLCTFVDGSATGKTVWDDTTGVYSQQDVRNMCSVALALSSGNAVRHVVQTPLNVKICIQATRQSNNFNAQTGAGQGSCFPVGTAAVAANVNVHSAC